MPVSNFASSAPPDAGAAGASAARRKSTNCDARRNNVTEVPPLRAESPEPHIIQAGHPAFTRRASRSEASGELFTPNTMLHARGVNHEVPIMPEKRTMNRAK